MEFPVKSLSIARRDRGYIKERPRGKHKRRVGMYAVPNGTVCIAVAESLVAIMVMMMGF